MKKYIFTLLFALVALTGCNNDEYYYYQTPGEITGEKITELVTNGGQNAQCIVEGYFNDVRRFAVEGQFLHVYGGGDYRDMTFDLNQLQLWSYVRSDVPSQNYFLFTFTKK